MINLDRLSVEGLPHFSKAWSQVLADSAIKLLEHSEHQSGVPLLVHMPGDTNITLPIIWTDTILDSEPLGWADTQEITEYGASGIGVLLALHITGHKTIERSVKGTGVDYWLGAYDDGSEPPFQRKERLEISGILKGTASDVRQRTNIKRRQTQQSQNTGLTAHVVVVEFSQPLAEHSQL